MDMSVKFGIYFLIITNTFVNVVLLKPVQSNRGRTIAQNGLWKTEFDTETRVHHRLQRQVVQPTWLTELNGKLKKVDARVHVNQQNLEEAAHLRKHIQDAVRRNEFAVLSPNAHTKSEEGGFAVVEPPMPSSSSMPSPAVPQIWPWSFPMHSNAPMSNPLFPASQPHGQNEFMEGMQRWWAEFIENSRRMFSWN